MSGATPGSVAVADDERNRVSPLAQARAGTYRVPTVLVHGCLDDLVPVGQARQMEEALAETGVDVRLLEIEGAGHSFDMEEPSRYDDVFESMMRFLRGRR